MGSPSLSSICGICLVTNYHSINLIQTRRLENQHQCWWYISLAPGQLSPTCSDIITSPPKQAGTAFKSPSSMPAKKLREDKIPKTAKAGLPKPDSHKKKWSSSHYCWQIFGITYGKAIEPPSLQFLESHLQQNSLVLKLPPKLTPTHYIFHQTQNQKRWVQPKFTSLVLPFLDPLVSTAASLTLWLWWMSLLDQQLLLLTQASRGIASKVTSSLNDAYHLTLECPEYPCHFHLPQCHGTKGNFSYCSGHFPCTPL